MNNMKKSLAVAKAIDVTAAFIGKAGIGKSAIIAEYAEENNLKLIDIRLSQIESIDLAGIPQVNKDNTAFNYLPLGSIPLNTYSKAMPLNQNKIKEHTGRKLSSVELNKLPPKERKLIHETMRYSGWLLLLDEITQASEQVEAAAYSIVWDRMVGNYKINDNVQIVLAGNSIKDSSLARVLSTPLINRTMLCEVALDFDCWYDWASENSINPMILNYLKQNKYDLLTDKAGVEQQVNSPRSWTNLSKAIDLDVDNFSKYAVSFLHPNTAQQFVSHTTLLKNVPDIEQIIASPNLVLIPSARSSIMYQVFSLARQTDIKNISAIMQYIKRLPVDISYSYITEIKKLKDLKNHIDVVLWETDNDLVAPNGG